MAATKNLRLEDWLRLGFFEAGCGWAPFWVDRIEEHFELAPTDFAGGDPHGTLTARTWLTFEVEERTLVSALDLGWEDHVCFASDYPHFDAVFPGAVAAVRAHTLGPARERELAAILEGPLARRFGLHLPDPTRTLALLYDRAANRGRIEAPVSSRRGPAWR